MTDGIVSPDLAAFTELATDWRVVPVTRRLLADAETPVGVYRKLAGGPGTFLLESAEQGVGSAGMAWSRYSFIGVRSSATLVERDGVATWLGQPPAGLPTEGDPVRVLRETVAALAGPVGDPSDGLPPLTGGMVGYLGYDLVRRFERLPRADRGRPGRAGAGHDARHRPGGARPLRRLGDPGRQRGAAPPDAPDRAPQVTAAYHHAVGRLDAMTTRCPGPSRR